MQFIWFLYCPFGEVQVKATLVVFKHGVHNGQVVIGRQLYESVSSLIARSSPVGGHRFPQMSVCRSASNLSVKVAHHDDNAFGLENCYGIF